MDNGRFDELSKLAATDGTRRGLLRVLSGGTLGAVVTGLGVREADAKKPKCKKRKKIGQVCKFKNGAKCKCRGGAVCKGKRCRCPNGTQQQGKSCVPTPTCLANGATCENGGSDACCSDFCTFEGPIDQVEPTCCVPNNQSCSQTSDCCANDENPAGCESGRCCRGQGGTCATPNGLQTARCCVGLICDVGDSNECIELPLGE
jgi:hypothetical protein